MQPSENCYNLIKGEESLRLTPYNDPTGNATIGYGHLLHLGRCVATDFQQWGTITQATAEDILKTDVEKFAVALNRLVTVQLNQNQFDALVDFVFNTGIPAFEKGHVLTFLNSNDFSDACRIMLEYVYSGSKVLAGLQARRKKEVALFEQPVANVNTGEDNVAENQDIPSPVQPE